MNDDWLLVSIDAVEEKVQVVCDVLCSAVEVLAPARQERMAGVRLTEIAAGLAARGDKARKNLDAAIDEYRHAVAALRGAVIRALVDEEGLTFSQIAREMSISRQMVARLYRAGRPRTDPHQD